MIEFDSLLLIQYSLLVPVVTAFLAVVIPFRNVRDAVVLLTSLALPFFVYKIYQALLVGYDLPAWKLFEIVPGIFIDFKTEAMSVLFAVMLAALWCVSLLYSIGYMRANNEGHQGRFYAFFSISIFASLGVAFSANLLTLFIFYELLTLVTYPLVIHHKGDKSRKAGRKYLSVLLGCAMILFLPAMLITFNSAGTLDFTVGGVLTDKVSAQMAMILLAMYLFGVAKTAIMPVHKWLPSAMVAPTPVSALLHAVAVVTVGVFTVVKIVIYIFGIDNLAKSSAEFGEYGDFMLYVSVFTIIAASVIALTKDNIKARLAYSTISQLAYVLMAVAMFSPKGVVAAVFQIVAHSIAKITMFFCAGAVATSVHKKKISEFSGVGRAMPVTMGAFAIAAISMIGLPPVVGFVGKWILIEGVMEAEQLFVLVVILISTMLNAAYFLPIVYKAFFEREEVGHDKIVARKYREAPVFMLIAICACALMVIALFLYNGALFEIIGMVGK